MTEYRLGCACLNGHAISGAADPPPGEITVYIPLPGEPAPPEAHAKPGQRYCDECGEEAITACKGCGAPLRGVRFELYEYHDSWTPPKHCHQCGVAFPWTSRWQSAAQDEIGLIEGLFPLEREQLQRTVPELLRDRETPNTRSTVIRWKQVLAKSEPAVQQLLVAILGNVASEYMMTQLGMKAGQ